MAEMDNFEYLISLVINTNKAFDEIYQQWAKVSAAIEKPLSIPIQGDPQLEKAIREAEKLRDAIKGIEAEVASAETEAKKFAKESESALRELEDVAKGAGSELAKAFEAGADKAEKALEDLVKRAEKNLGNVVPSAVIETATAAVAGRRARYIERDLTPTISRKEREAAGLEAQIKEAKGAAKKKLQAEYKTIQAELAELYQTLETLGEGIGTDSLALKKAKEAGKKAEAALEQDAARLVTEVRNLDSKISEAKEKGDDEAVEKFTKAYNDLLQQKALIDRILDSITTGVQESTRVLDTLRAEFSTGGISGSPEEIRRLGTSFITSAKGAAGASRRAEELTSSVQPSVVSYGSLLADITRRQQAAQMGLGEGESSKGGGGDAPGGFGGSPIGAWKKELEELIIRLRLDTDYIREQIQTELSRAPFTLDLGLEASTKALDNIREAVEGLGTLESSKALTISVGVNEKYLLDSIRTSLARTKDDPEYAVYLTPEIAGTRGVEHPVADAPSLDIPSFPLDVDKPHFIQSLQEAITEANKNIKLNVTPGLDPLVEELKQMALESRERGKANRARRLKEEQDRKRRAILRKEVSARVHRGDVLEVFEEYFPEGSDLARQVMAATVPGADGKTMERAFRAAHELEQKFLAYLKALGPTPSDELTIIETLQSSFGAAFSTGVKSKERTERQKELTRNIKEAEKEAWAAQADEIRKEIQGFALFREDHSVYRPFHEAQRTYQAYVAAQRRYQTEAMDIYNLETTEDWQQHIRRLRSARDNLRRQDRAFRTRALDSTGKTVQVIPMQISKDGAMLLTDRPMETRTMGDANARVEQFFRRTFEGAYSDYTATMAEKKRPPVDFNTFLEGSMKGQNKYLRFYARLKGESDQVLRNEQMRQDFLDRHIKPLRDNYNVLVSTNRELEKQVQQHRALEKYQLLRQRRQQQMGPYRQAIRSAAYVLGGSAIGLGAAWQVRDSFRTYIELQQELAGIQGVIQGRSQFDAQMIGRGVMATAQRYGADLIETAKAARVLAQSGLDANEVVRELDSTMLAMRGMGVTVEQAQELQIAIRAITDESERAIATMHAFDRISAVEARYAVNAMDLSDAIRNLSPVMKQYENDIAGITDAIDYTSAVTTVMVEQLRITGTESANAFKFMLSRLMRPELLKRLQEEYGLAVAREDGSDFLALPDLLGEIARRYQELNADEATRAQAKMFAVQLAGGRQVNRIIPVLEKFDRVQQIATQSSMAFGDAQERAEIAIDTLGVRLDRLRTNFKLFIGNMLESSSAADVMKGSVGAAADVLGGVTGQGAGPISAAALTLGIGAAGRGSMVGYSWLSTAMLMGSDAGAFRAAQRQQQLEAARETMKKFGQVGERTGGGLAAIFGRLARIFTPGGVLIGGLILTSGILGKIYNWWTKGRHEVDRYRASIKSLQDLDIWSSPQFQAMDQRAVALGFGTAHGSYQRMRSVGLEAIGQRMSSVQAQFGGSSWTEVLEALQGDPSKWRTFRKEFTEAFIDDLGKAGDKLRELPEPERIAEVGRLIGDTFFAMTFQVEQAMTAIRASYTRMAEESKEALHTLDRTQREGWIQKVAGALKDFFGGDSLQRQINLRDSRQSSDVSAWVDGRKVTARHGGVARRMAEGMSESDARRAVELEAARRELDRILQKVLPGGLHNAITATQEFNEVLKELQETAEDGKVTFLDVMETWFERVNDPEIRKGIAQHLAAQMALASGNEELAKSIYPSVTIAKRIEDTSDEARAQRLRANIESLMQDTLNIANQAAYDTIDGADELRAQIRALKAAWDDSRAIQNAMFALDGVTGALFKFQDRLLDIIFGLHEQYQKMRVEEDMAQRFGFTFDRGERLTSIGRNLYEQVAMLPVIQDIDIAKVTEQIRRLNLLETETKGEGVLGGMAFSGFLAGLSDEASSELFANMSKQSKKLERELKAMREGAIRMRDLREGGLVGLWPTGENFAEGTRILEQLQDAFRSDDLVTGFQRRLEEQFGTLDLGTIFEGLDREYKSAYDSAGMEAAEDVLKNRVAPFFISLGQYYTLLQEASLQDMEARKDAIEKEAEILRLQLPIQARIGDQMRLQEEMERRKYEVALEELELKRMIYNISDNDYLLAKRQLEIQYIRNREHERELQLEQAKNALRSRVVDTMRESMIGLRNALTNLDIMTSILNAEDAKEKAEAVSQAIIGVFGPLADALHGRVVDNLMDQMLEAMEGSDVLSGVFSTAEFRLQATIQEAHGYGAITVAEAIVQAHRAGATMISATIGGERVSVPIPVDISTGTGEGGQPPQSNRWGIATNLGMLAGTMGGLMASRNKNQGRVGRYAQITSSVGSTAGAALGNFLLPGVGGAAGGVLGGILGGLFGGSPDEQESPTIRVLQAIERAQKDTITAIEQQTDSLLSLENRFLNAPSTFQMPGPIGAFAPVGRAGRAEQVVNNSYREFYTSNFNVTVNASPGMDEDRLVKQVERAVGNLLKKDRRDRRRG